MDRAIVYMLRCMDDSVYTGITTDIKRRMKEHVFGGKRSAKYTKVHGFKRLEVAFEVHSWSEAAKLEYALKRQTKKEKEALIQTPKLVEALALQLSLERCCLLSPALIMQCNEESERIREERKTYGKKETGYKK